MFTWWHLQDSLDSAEADGRRCEAGSPHEAEGRSALKTEKTLGEREFTTEEIAQMCGVSRPAVVEWIGRGLLTARLTEGGHRRVARAALANFLSQQGYKLPSEVARAKPLVVVIDDETIWRATLEAHLSAGYDVRTFGQGVEVLVAIGALRPDIIVVDTRMPGFDSYALLEALRRHKALEECLVVGLTQTEDEAAGARSIGAHGALSKARIGELPQLLTRLLMEHQRRVGGPGA